MKEIRYSSSDIGKKVVCPGCKNLVELISPAEVQDAREYAFPKQLEVQIVDSENEVLPIENIIIAIKRGFLVGLFLTNKNGRVEVLRKDYKEAKDDHISTGIMDFKYRNYDQIKTIQVEVLSEEEINKFIEGRKKNWSCLLNNESKRWGTFEEFIMALQDNNNSKANPVKLLIDLSRVQCLDCFEVKIKLNINQSKKQL